MSTPAFIGTLDTTTGTIRARYVRSGGNPARLGPTVAQLITDRRHDLAALMTILTEAPFGWSLLDADAGATQTGHPAGRGLIVAGVGVALHAPEAGSEDQITAELDAPCPGAAARTGSWGYLLDSTDPATARLHLITVTDRFASLGHVAVAELHQLDWDLLETAARRGAALPAPMRPAGETTRRPAMRLSGPAELITALPSLLGFTPAESLVLISTGRRERRRIGLTIRVDLPDPAHAAELAEQVATHMQRDDRSETAALIIVAAPHHTDLAGVDLPEITPPHADLAAAVTTALGSFGIEVHTSVWVPAIEHGAPWACYGDCRCYGILDDPGASTFAAEMVTRGKPVYADRSDLIRLVAPTPAATQRIPHATATGIDLLRTPASIDASIGASRDHDLLGLDLHEQARAAAQAGALQLDDETLRHLAAALARPRVRDSVLVAALTAAAPSETAPSETAPTSTIRAGRGERDGAEGDGTDTDDTEVGPGYETLWAALARELPDPDAADAAALLAAAALARGDGAMANVALDRAAQACPNHSLTGLLRQVAEIGLPPWQVRAALLGRPGQGS